MYKGYKVVALFISRISEFRMFSFLDSLYNSLQAKGYKLFVFHTCSDLYWGTPNELADTNVYKLLNNVIDAVVIFDEAFLDKSFVAKIISRSNELQIPVICVSNEYPGCVNYLFKYEKGFEMVVRHVIEEHNITDTHLIAGNRDNDFSQKRIDMYKQVLYDNNLPFDESMVSYGDYWWKPTEEAVEGLIESGRLPKAIICVNDSMAVTACSVLQRHGYSIPEDIIVTGFDGTRETTLCSPTITTCQYSDSAVTSQISEIISDIFNNKPHPMTLEAEFSLRKGGSCGCNMSEKYSATGTLLKHSEDLFNGYQENERRLYELSERIITSDTGDDFITVLNRLNLEDSCILLNKDWMGNYVNPITYNRSTPFDDEVYAVYRNIDGKTDTGYDTISPDDFIPNLDDVIKKDTPILFNVLSYLGVPIGYMCFYAPIEHGYYCRIVQHVFTLNRTFGNYKSIKYLEQVAKQMEEMSSHDFLTGLYNRHGFYHVLETMFPITAYDTNTVILVASVDSDGLKYINDNFGHDAGDYSIRTISDAIRSIPFTKKLCSRFGGDEWVVLAVLNSDETPEMLINAVNEYLDKVNSESDKPFTVSASIGYAVSSIDNFNFDELYKLADSKMYECKLSKPHSRR